jgi:hypothetical protein
MHLNIKRKLYQDGLLLCEVTVREIIPHSSTHTVGALAQPLAGLTHFQSGTVNERIILWSAVRPVVGKDAAVEMSAYSTALLSVHIEAIEDARDGFVVTATCKEPHFLPEFSRLAIT